VEEAIEIALLERDVERAGVEVDVSSKGRAGILGIGAEPAKVRVRPIHQDSGNAGAALTAVARVLRGMGVDALPTIRSSGSGPDDPAVIDVQGADAALLIGRRGETLRAMQFVVNLVVSSQSDEPSHVVVDVEGYRARRQQVLEALAQRTASRVESSNSPITLEPMSAADRRIIHMTLSTDNGVSTESSGEGPERKVTIRPANGTAAEGK